MTWSCLYNPAVVPVSLLNFCDSDLSSWLMSSLSSSRRLPQSCFCGSQSSRCLSWDSSLGLAPLLWASSFPLSLLNSSLMLAASAKNHFEIVCHEAVHSEDEFSTTLSLCTVPVDTRLASSIRRPFFGRRRDGRTFVGALSVNLLLYVWNHSTDAMLSFRASRCLVSLSRCSNIRCNTQTHFLPDKK